MGECPTQIQPKKTMMKWSRDGSVERRQGDQDDHNEDDPRTQTHSKQIKSRNAERYEAGGVLPPARNNRSHNPTTVYKGNVENIYESKAYLSNQPNLTNVGNKAGMKLFSKLNTNVNEKKLNKELKKLGEGKIFEVEGKDYELILDDPFIEQEAEDLQEFGDENTKSFSSRQYKTVG